MPQTNHISRWRILALALALVLFGALLASTPSDEALAAEPLAAANISPQDDSSFFSSGSGTQDDPYRIVTVQQLLAFANAVDAGNSYQGKFIQLDSELDFKNYSSSPDFTWNPIGDEAAVDSQGDTVARGTSFAGTFDGQLHPIKGIKIAKGVDGASAKFNYAGFFAALAPTATVKNVVLEDVSIEIETTDHLDVGGIAGHMDGGDPNATSGSSKGAVVTNCSVSGAMNVRTVTGSNANKQAHIYAGGVVGRQITGAVVNCESNVAIDGTVVNGMCHEGGIAGLSNRGLLANSYVLGDVRGSAKYLDASEPSYLVLGSLVGMLSGELVNCYTRGSVEAVQDTKWAGATFGWIGSEGKAYNCFYDGSASLIVAGEVDELPPYGESDSSALCGGIFKFFDSPESALRYSDIVDSLNRSFEEFPTDIKPYGLDSGLFFDNAAFPDQGPFFAWFSADGIKTREGDRKTVFPAEKGLVTFSALHSRPTVNYVAPSQEGDTFYDGTYYGRSEDGLHQVAVEVKNGTPLPPHGASSKAVARAKEKAACGDISSYGKPMAGLFSYGSGAQDDPYLIENESDLRAIARAINEDNDWAGIYFRQTADITISSDEPWLPIGWGIVPSNGVAPYEYPFAGTYDGGGYTISGLTVTVDETDAKTAIKSDPTLLCRSYAAGLFGLVNGATIVNVELHDATVDAVIVASSNAGVLVGLAKGDFVVQNCNVTGAVSLRTLRDSGVIAATIAAGGLIGSAKQGSIVASSAHVDVEVQAASGDAFAGGLIGLDDEVMSVGCSAEGNVTGGSNKENKAHVGGLTGQTSGIQYNCYATGNVAATSKTADAGLLNGALTGSAVERRCYYNEDAALTVAGASVSPKQAEGTTNGIAAEAIAAEPRAESDFDTSAFQATLAQNQADLAQELDAIAALLGSSVDESALRYYTALDLAHAVVKFATPKIAYSGHAWAPEPVVTLSGKALVRGQDYEVTAYRDNVNAGIARVTVTGTGVYHGTATGYFTIEKAPSKLSSKVLKKTLKAKAGKTAKFKAKKTFRITANTSGGKVTYKLTKVPKKAKKKIKVSKAGKVTVKKGLARGTYKIKVRITSAETANYQSASKTVALKIRVR